MLVDMGEFQVAIDVPDEVAREYQVVEDEPLGMPFREYWLPPEIANRYRESLRVIIPEEPDEEVPVALFRQEHGVVVTERFTAFGEDNPAPVGARCVCGKSWRWEGSRSGTDPRDEFPSWLADHAGDPATE